MQQNIFDFSKGTATKCAFRGAQRPSTPQGLSDECYALDFNSFQLTPLGGDVFSYYWSGDMGQTWGAAVPGINTQIDVALPDWVNGVKVVRTAGAGSSIVSINTESPVTGVTVSNQTIVPTLGGTGNIANSPALQVNVLLDFAVLLALYTLNLPSAPLHNQVVTIFAAYAILGLTLGPAPKIIGEATSIDLGGFCSFVYNSAKDRWYRCG